MSTTIDTTPDATPVVWDTSDNVKIDDEALSLASENLATAMAAGATAVQRVSALVHMICHWTVQARLAITLENGLPDFKGGSKAAAQAVQDVQNTAYENMSNEDAAMLRNRVRSVLPVHLDSSIADWTRANREGMPAASDLKYDGDGKDVDLEAGDRPRRVIDAPAKLRTAVAKVYKQAELTPQKGRWGQPAKAATNAKDTQDKIESAPLEISAASAVIRASGTTLDSASTNVWDLADSMLDAARAANLTESTETRETKDAAAAKLLAASVLLAVASATLTESGPTPAAEKKADAARFPRETAEIDTPAETVEG